MTTQTESMGAAQRHFDNLSPDDFGPPAEVDCDRCSQSVESHAADYCEVEGEWTCRGECTVICEACGDFGPLEGAIRDEDGWICPECGTAGQDAEATANNKPNLTAHNLTDGWCVEDADGGVLWPSEDTAKAIAASPNPAAAAIAACLAPVESGDWHC